MFQYRLYKYNISSCSVSGCGYGKGKLKKKKKTFITFQIEIQYLNGQLYNRKMKRHTYGHKVTGIESNFGTKKIVTTIFFFNSSAHTKYLESWEKKMKSKEKVVSQSYSFSHKPNLHTHTPTLNIWNKDLP